MKMQAEIQIADIMTSVNGISKDLLALGSGLSNRSGRTTKQVNKKCIITVDFLIPPDINLKIQPYLSYIKTDMSRQ